MRNPEVIIVGSGSAGCLLAARLAQSQRFGGNGHKRILLVEPPSKRADLSDRQRPSHWLNLLCGPEDWDFAATTSQALADRVLRWPRGRGMGGSSRINAMIWFPPTDADFHNLATSLGVDVAKVRAAFASVRKIVQPEDPRFVSETGKAFSQSARSMGGQPMIYQRFNRMGRRWNPAVLLEDFADQIQVARAFADRIVFNGDRACGVVVGNETVLCESAVVLCAGTIGTPSVLMRSGIGPPDILADCGIQMRQAEPCVGANLQDHLIMPVIFGLEPERRFQMLPSDDDVQSWNRSGEGPIASNIAEAGGLFDDDRIQLHVTPTHYLKFPYPDAPAAMTIGVNVTRPASRGQLRIVSSHREATPRIEANYLTSGDDLQTTIRGVRLARELAAAEPLASLCQAEQIPGTRRESDESIAKSIARFAQTLYHPVGTAAGLSLPENLHIADASALSQITVGNPTASIMTLAHCVADRLLS